MYFNQSCYALDTWNVGVTLPDSRESASYVLPSSEAVVNAGVTYNLTGTDATLVEIYTTAGWSGGKAPSLRATINS